MQAVILAAGMGKRLKELTKNNTKCMVKVNGVSLIERMLSQLEKKNLSRIIIVVGYKAEELKNYIDTLNICTPVVYVENKVYNETNNIYSLALAKEYLCEEDTLLFESDLIFEDSVIDEILNDPRETLALVDKYESWMDGTCVKLDSHDNIEAFVPKDKFKFNEINKYYKTVNIYKFSRHFSEKYYVPFLDAYSKALGNNEYYEQVLRVITMLDNPQIKSKRLSGQLWYEIDDIQDLDIAASMFADSDKKLKLIQSRYGGYWRYPQVLDFCYLVNPYFPPRKLTDEIKASFEKLITQYPSGMGVNSLLAAKNFGINVENIIVGNGAAELIKSLMSVLDGVTGFVRPTFEEYPNRYDSGKSVYFRPENKNFSYNVSDIKEFFEDKNINNLVIVNPDNPTGNYIPSAELLKLAEWTESKSINLVIDESFVDFADEENATLIKQDILDGNKHMFVMKSISKSYGVPGLRLGVLVSGNKSVIDFMKKDVAIWNINSFAEFYMQIAEKYNSDYSKALEKFRTERKRFVTELEKINGLRVIPSQANYVTVELTGNLTSSYLAKVLFVKYNILIKDLSSKIETGQYIRLAIRNTEDNNKLLNSLKSELGGIFS